MKKAWLRNQRLICTKELEKGPKKVGRSGLRTEEVDMSGKVATQFGSK